jgi:hypothetical protein
VREVGARKLEQLALIGARALLENNKGVRRLAPAFIRFNVSSSAAEIAFATR